MLSIGAFSRMSHVTTKTLRYYDEIGLIKPIHVNSENGYRYYEVSQLKTILMIDKLKSYCFSLDEISDVLKNPDDNHLMYFLIKQKQRDIQEKQTHYQDILKHLNEDISNLERGIHIMSYVDKIPVTLVETQPQTILSIRAEMSTHDIGRHIAELYRKVEQEKLTITGAPMNIYHIGIDQQFNPEQYDNELAIPVMEAIKGTRELNAGLCAMATLHGPYTELPSIYTRLNQWIEEEGYTPTGAPYEAYVSDPFKVKPEENITEVYIPVKK